MHFFHLRPKFLPSSSVKAALELFSASVDFQRTLRDIKNYIHSTNLVIWHFLTYGELQISDRWMDAGSTCLPHYCSSCVTSLWFNRAGKQKFENGPLKQWNSCQFAVLVELQSSGSELGDPSCLSPPGSIALKAYFQGHLTNSVVEFDNVGSDPEEPPDTAAAEAAAQREVYVCVCVKDTLRKWERWCRFIEWLQNKFDCI